MMGTKEIKDINGLLQKLGVAHVFSMKDRNEGSKTHRSNPSFILKAGKPEDFFGSLADYRLIRQNVALKAVTQQQTEGMLMNLND